jgi:hypothetical protein
VLIGGKWFGSPWPYLNMHLFFGLRSGMLWLQSKRCVVGVTMGIAFVCSVIVLKRVLSISSLNAASVPGFGEILCLSALFF